MSSDSKYIYEVTQYPNSFACRIYLASIRITVAENGNFKTKQEATDWADAKVAEIEEIERYYALRYPKHTVNW